ncbi:hypothetical protein CAK95_00845 [Pseudorhodoplanes sinuspersici]|uniref:Uncharacterized protein n=1 Tax=Pseudorhodoplanes sinuspersici TaxID=1235591 RepID=A0A1W6ZKM5_9HYPH|nr:hypothetical protein CAK95_00845 [Pseudorhodoplanes sinuspersici]
MPDLVVRMVKAITEAELSATNAYEADPIINKITAGRTKHAKASLDHEPAQLLAFVHIKFDYPVVPSSNFDAQLTPIPGL